MSVCSGIQQIPAEIIEVILSNECIDHQDFGNLSITCSFLYHVCKNNELWKMKLQQRWPALFENYGCEYYDWKDEFVLQHRSHVRVLQNLIGLSQKYFQKADIAEKGFSDLCAMLQQHTRANWFIVNSLRAIIHDGHRDRNLTHKYYARKALQFVQHEHLRSEWTKYLELPPHKQSLEKGAVLVAQWFQTSKHITETTLTKQLHSIIEDAKEEVISRNANFTLPDEPQGYAVPEISPQDCRLALEALNHVLFDKHGFHGNEDDYYNCENSYLNKVLETKAGIPISLSILYITIAKHLGVECEPVSFPSHFLVKWKEHPELVGSEQYTYIDVFNKGKFLTQHECSSIEGLTLGLHAGGEAAFKAVTSSQVFERVARNLINIGHQHSTRRQSEEGIGFLKQAVELLSTIKPSDVDNKIFRVRLYLYLGVNITKAREILERLETIVSHSALWGNIHQIQSLKEMVEAHIEEEHHKDASETIIAKRRSEEKAKLTYSVGMVMHHKKYDYTCVIFGWDFRCTATEDWIYHMGVHLLSNKHHQPFYNVLVDDGSNRYAAQENLGPHPNPEEVPHAEIGKYFSEFRETYYMANAEQRQQYPDDMEHTTKFSQEYYVDALGS